MFYALINYKGCQLEIFNLFVFYLYIALNSYLKLGLSLGSSYEHYLNSLLSKVFYYFNFKARFYFGGFLQVIN